MLGRPPTSTSWLQSCHRKPEAVPSEHLKKKRQHLIPPRRPCSHCIAFPHATLLSVLKALQALVGNQANLLLKSDVLQCKWVMALGSDMVKARGPVGIEAAALWAPVGSPLVADQALLLLVLLLKWMVPFLSQVLQT